MLVAAQFPAVKVHGADLEPIPTGIEQAIGPTVIVPPRLNSIFLFGGRMSGQPIGRTLAFNLGSSGQTWDNFIVGGAFQREFWRWGAISVAAEIGIADRFGKFEVCCTILVRSDKAIHTVELWGGFALRHDGPLLFDSIRLAPAAIVGVSAATKSIGAEREHEVLFGGEAGFLFYLGLEFALSHVTAPELELVTRLHHRSGAWGTLSKGDHAGYNAWISGVRYRF